MKIKRVMFVTTTPVWTVSPYEGELPRAGDSVVIEDKCYRVSRAVWDLCKEEFHPCYWDVAVYLQPE